ncbi:MAG: hypothetical protein ACLQU5_22555 [Isosphaeraceae bacterium]
MPYEIRYSSEAVEQLKKLRVFDGTAILDQIGQILTVDPTVLARFARALHTAIKKGRGAHTFSPREKVPRRGG